MQRAAKLRAFSTRQFKQINHFKRLKRFQSFQDVSMAFPFKKTSVIREWQLGDVSAVGANSKDRS
jgi:hypothetical protein